MFRVCFVLFLLSALCFIGQSTLTADAGVCERVQMRRGARVEARAAWRAEARATWRAYRVSYGSAGLSYGSAGNSYGSTGNSLSYSSGYGEAAEVPVIEECPEGFCKEK